VSTIKNQAARAQETREQKRTRLADPALAGSVENQRQDQASNITLQINMTAARKQEFENRKRMLDADIVGLKRMKDRAARGYTEAAKAGYDRIYERGKQLAQVLADTYGIAVSYPPYDPPTNVISGEVVTIKPRSAEERAAEGAYRETKGMGPSGKGSGVLPGYPGTDAGTAWLNVQGVKP
jgi:predicted secreted protein